MALQCESAVHVGYVSSPKSSCSFSNASSEDADSWLVKTRLSANIVLSEFKKSSGNELFTGNPFTAIREVQQDGSDILIGNITIARWAHGEVLGFSDGPVATMDENLSLKKGDPNIVWTIGGVFVVFPWLSTYSESHEIISLPLITDKASCPMQLKL